MTTRLGPGLRYKALVQCGHFIWHPSRAHGVAVAIQYDGIRQNHFASHIRTTWRTPSPIEPVYSVIKRLRAAQVVLRADKIATKNFKEPAKESVKRPPSFTLTILPRHLVSDTAFNDYFWRLTSLTGRVASLLIHQSLTEPLWISTYTRRGKETGLRNSAISVTSQRKKSAFRAALRMHGYDSYGRRIEKSSDKPEQLYGTVILHADAADAIKTEYSSIVEYYHDIIDRLVPILGCAAGKMPPLLSTKKKGTRLPEKTTGHRETESHEPANTVQ
ncbi:hypothetical protein MCOR25_004415 [Pyricularia grisea]|uniref:Uncharacterized protein n=1 Tax=Pyricularia grisea TaxID=148305 RepID=A0A6P8AXF7_PYRGI|nr:hypothetical protein PgNI_10578 [Pyricularia grisea]KAI6369458.1 hypothetical protein MCOR25_004415 [Pyricularia grisea]TLD06979.1 hypothetical protein PgNI_10578 [Pyricularia grisea]